MNYYLPQAYDYLLIGLGVGLEAMGYLRFQGKLPASENRLFFVPALLLLILIVYGVLFWQVFPGMLLFRMYAAGYVLYLFWYRLKRGLVSSVLIVYPLTGPIRSIASLWPRK